MSFLQLIKKYFLESKKTIIINIIIFIFSLVFISLSKFTTLKNQLIVTKLYISDFPPQLIDTFNSNIYDLQLSTYANTERKTDNLRQITLSWKRENDEEDNKKFNIIKNRLENLINRYIVLSDIQIKRILNDYDNCMIYLYKDQAKLPRQVLEVEQDIEYAKWFKKNLNTLVELDRKDEDKFFGIVTILDIIYSTIFITIFFIFLVNFVRFQK